MIVHLEAKPHGETAPAHQAGALLLKKAEKLRQTPLIEASDTPAA